jgi:radical SAM protein with 4Fe4S-binding SPASM domain
MADAGEMGMAISVISNGTCFGNACFPILKRFQPNLQITFDGYDAASHDVTRGAGNFERITSGIVTARKNGYRGAVSARVNLHRKNIGHMREMLGMFERKFDVDGENFRDINDIGMALLHKSADGGGAFQDYLESEEYARYPEIFDMFSEWNANHKTRIQYDFNNPDIGCAFNNALENVQCGIRVALDGNVFPCQLLMDDEFRIGSVHDESLQEIMRGEKLAAFLDAIHARRGSVEQCKPCAYKGMCAGGCPAQAYIENGTLNSVSARCTSRKSHFSAELSKALRELEQKARITD